MSIQVARVPHPEAAAAVVNAALVLLLPLAFIWLEYGGHGAAVDAARLGQAAVTLVPFAALTAWRTRVHAARRRAGQASGWQAVAEAAATAVVVAIAYLAPGILTRPADAPAYLLYAGLALVLGALVGLILRATALLTLAVHKWTFAESDRALRRQ